MTDVSGIDRRSFLQVSALAGGALLLEFGMAGAAQIPKRKAVKKALDLKAWIRIDEDGTVTMTIHKAELGQGVQTSLAALMAEEMDADWSKVTTRWADASDDYKARDSLITGASLSIHQSWRPLRRFGAMARNMLIRAAAKQWGVDPEQCFTEPGVVIHKPSGDRLSYGMLAKPMLEIPKPKRVPLKDPKDFRIIGRTLMRKDGPGKVSGKAIYGWDVRIPGMLVAQIELFPTVGAKVKSFDASETLKVPGVRHVISLESEYNPGVAVVADNFWAAGRGREKLRVEWAEGQPAQFSDQNSRDMLEATLSYRGSVRGKGNFQKAIKAAAKTIEATYTTPYFAHMTMETMSATAHHHDGVTEIWAPLQDMERAQAWVSRAVGSKYEQVMVHNTYAGGAFGRRLQPDYTVQAAELSKRLGIPVQVLWTRQDDVRSGHYHPITLARLEAGIDENQKVIAWYHKLAGLSKPEPTLFAGLDEVYYDFPNTQNEGIAGLLPMNTGPYRSVGRVHNVFARECFIDEIAHATGKDPFIFRRDLLTKNKRLSNVLTRAAERAEWDKPLPRFEAWGLALNADKTYRTNNYFAFGAVAARVKIDGNKIKVTKVVGSIDCGFAVDPGNVAAQVEGSVVFGMATALFGKISVRHGQAQESNYHDYPVPRMEDMPVVEADIVPSAETPTGAGEVMTALTIAAIGNAVFRATGKRLRDLPLRLT